MSFSEVERQFLVFTTIGRDLKKAWPRHYKSHQVAFIWTRTITQEQETREQHFKEECYTPSRPPTNRWSKWAPTIATRLLTCWSFCKSSSKADGPGGILLPAITSKRRLWTSLNSTAIKEKATSSKKFPYNRKISVTDTTRNTFFPRSHKLNRGAEGSSRDDNLRNDRRCSILKSRHVRTVK